MIVALEAASWFKMGPRISKPPSVKNTASITAKSPFENSEIPGAGGLGGDDGGFWDGAGISSNMFRLCRVTEAPTRSFNASRKRSA
jgi:hypothetical protein